MNNQECVILHIERLILDGISIPQRHRSLVQAAIEQELARLIETGGIAATLHTSGALQRVPAGVLKMDESDEPRRLAEKIARAIYEGIGQ